MLRYIWYLIVAISFTNTRCVQITWQLILFFCNDIIYFLVLTSHESVFGLFNIYSKLTSDKEWINLKTISTPRIIDETDWNTSSNLPSWGSKMSISGAGIDTLSPGLLGGPCRSVSYRQGRVWRSRSVSTVKPVDCNIHEDSS